MRLVAMLVAAIAALGSSYGALAAMRAVGPDDQTDVFGYGDAATISPGGGDLLEAKNFARVVTALRRELGPDGRLTSLQLERTEARALAVADGRVVYVDVDASGRSESRTGDDATPSAVMPVSRLEAAPLDKVISDAQHQSNALVDSLSLDTRAREWSIDMNGGEPDRYLVNLDGSGLRLPDEPNPAPVGAGQDSLLRKQNLARVLAAARKLAPAGARITSVDIRPERVGLEFDTGNRKLRLDYGYDAVLTSRDLSAQTGADAGSVSFEEIDTGAPERMARAAERLLKVGLGDVQYVLLNLPSSPGEKPNLSMYFSSGHQPSYALADLHGRKFTWPGRS
jgi:hypothetical protein